MSRAYWLTRYYWARIKWNVRKTDFWWGMTHLGLAVRVCLAKPGTIIKITTTPDETGKGPQWIMVTR